MGGKGKSAVEIEMLEHEVRDVLNRTAPRRFAVLRPLRLVIENYPEGQVEEMEAVNNPEDPSAGTRKVPFARELWIERDDFMEDPPSKFFRLAPGREVRLRYAYFVTCTDVVKDASGEIVELRCTYDPETRGGDAPDGRRPKATLHWLSSEHAVPAEVRLYDRLFTRPDPGADGDLFADLNPNSETVLEECLVEPALAELPVGETVQFERLGYFCPDPDSTPGRLVFNRTLGLRDTWARLQRGPWPMTQAPEPQDILTPLTEAAIFLVADRRSRAARRSVRDLLADVSGLQAIGRLPHSRGRADVRGRHRRRRCGTGCSARRARPGCTRSPASPAPRTRAPATPGDLLFHIRAHRLDLCFELAQRLTDRLARARARGRRGARVQVVRRARPARLRRRHREPGGRRGARRGR